ncbi:hypothetical protein MKW94_012225 [Papaver nudicaule]|uniref:VQ domain-containing protein n=1 Tax=Papaver nudicaule TaxID=74823 RepID=A0AA41V424_PAPNU|nr:hypothetical protein [Papaver nudicaule]
MSPSQFRNHHHHDDHDLHRQQQQQQRLVINDVNCLRKTTNSGTPLPLKVNKESHQIHKSSSSSLTSSATSSINGVINGPPPSSKNHQQQQQRHPVIIYTHSPKIIHTQARDFMALVQKLTGLSHTDQQQQNQSGGGGGGPVDTKQSASGINKFNNNGSSNNLRGGGGDDTGSSSVVTTDENCGVGGCGGGGFGSNIHQVSSSGSLDPMINNNNYITDIPIFTPNSLDFLYSSSSRSFYRYPTPMMFPPTGNSAEITKPEY